MAFAGEAVVHLKGRFVNYTFADHLGWDSYRCGVRGDRVKDYAACPYSSPFTDLYVAKYFGAGSDEYSLSYLGVTVAELLAGPAQGHLVEDGDIIFYNCGLTDDYTGGMVDEDTGADTGGGVDIYSKDFGYSILEAEGQGVASLLPEPVGDTVTLQSVKAFKVEEGD